MISENVSYSKVRGEKLNKGIAGIKDENKVCLFHKLRCWFFYLNLL